MTTPAGVCRFCGCSEYDACVHPSMIGASVGVANVGCSWADVGRRVCSVCAPAAKAEGKALKVLRRSYAITVAWLAAFHRGFLVGWFQISARSLYSRNPYHKKVISEAWRLGQRAGAEASRSYVTVCGPIQNAPRRDVLRVGRPSSPSHRAST